MASMSIELTKAIASVRQRQDARVAPYGARADRRACPNQPADHHAERPDRQRVDEVPARSSHSSISFGTAWGAVGCRRRRE